MFNIVLFFFFYSVVYLKEKKKKTLLDKPYGSCSLDRLRLSLSIMA